MTFPNPIDPSASAPRARRRRRIPKPDQDSLQTERSPVPSADSDVTPGGRRRRNKQQKPSQINSDTAPHHAQPPRAQPVQTNPASTSPPGAIATPRKHQTAYAGPTFHASPAASSLPIPKRFQKGAQQPSSQPGSASPSDAGSSPASSPPSPSPASPAHGLVNGHQVYHRIGDPSHADISTTQQLSPFLNKLFQKDREEKAMKTSGHASNNTTSPSLVLSPSPPISSPTERPNHFPHNSIDGVARAELDGATQALAKPPPNIRSTTAPSRIPQETTSESERIALLKSITAQTTSATPPRVKQPLATGSAPRNQTPSPFHNINGQASIFSDGIHCSSTPPPSNAPRDPSLHYGNRNLSTLFKTASGRQGSYPELNANIPLSPTSNTTFRHATTPVRQAPNNIPYGSRRPSAPHLQFTGYPKPDTQLRPPPQPARSRPNSYAADEWNWKSSLMPSSVQAKLRSPPPANGVSTVEQNLEQNLKRMLKLQPTAPTEIPVAR